jgi:DNA-directed RNA polymerase subunit M/transcription elongation factor TFIIS
MTTEKKIQTQNTDDPTCPFCGSKDEEWYHNLVGMKEDGDAWETNCDSCDNIYKITMIVTATFNTEKLLSRIF